jgi:hypothetical protein
MMIQKHGTGFQRSRTGQSGVLSHESHDVAKHTPYPPRRASALAVASL